MTPSAAGASAAADAPQPSRVRRALWWASDYLYAARRQAAILHTPWAIGRRRPVPTAWSEGSESLPEVILLPGVYEHWTFLRPLGNALLLGAVAAAAAASALTQTATAAAAACFAIAAVALYGSARLGR